MKKLITVFLIAGLIAMLGIGFYTWHMSECWAWYDAGYDDAMGDFGIEFINGHRTINERDWCMFDAGFDYAFDYVDLPCPERPTEIDLCGQTYCRTY